MVGYFAGGDSKPLTVQEALTSLFDRAGSYSSLSDRAGEQSTIILSPERRDDGFDALRNAVVDGPPRVLLDRIVSHLKAGCYKIISLSVGGPQGDHQSTCVLVISSTLSLTELRRRGFEWNKLSSAETTASPNIAPLSRHEKDRLEEQVRTDTSTEMVRMDFVNCHWRSSYNIIRGGFHNKSIERALLLVDDAIKAGCFKLEALSAVRSWCTVTIDTDLTKEELRAKGFIWHGMGTEDVSDEDGCIVMPGWSRADEGWEDEKGNWVLGQWERRDL